jgi:hypothetical protein
MQRHRIAVPELNLFGTGDCPYSCKTRLRKDRRHARPNRSPHVRSKNPACRNSGRHCRSRPHATRCASLKPISWRSQQIVLTCAVPTDDDLFSLEYTELSYSRAATVRRQARPVYDPRTYRCGRHGRGVQSHRYTTAQNRRNQSPFLAIRSPTPTARSASCRKPCRIRTE